MQSRRAFGFLVVWCALFCALIFVQRVHAQATCGWLACEELIAGEGSGDFRHWCGEPGSAKGLVSVGPPPSCAPAPGRCGIGTEAQQIVCHYSQRIRPTESCVIAAPHSMNLCNCAARPEIGLPNLFGRVGAGAKTCQGGCTYVPKGPSITTPDITGQTAGTVINSPAGWRPDGTNCNPLATTPREDTTSTPNPNCDGEQCISASDDNPPKFCMQAEGKGEICISADDVGGPCEGNSGDGYLLSLIHI